MGKLRRACIKAPFLIGEWVRFKSEALNPDLHGHLIGMAFEIVGRRYDGTHYALDGDYPNGVPCMLSGKASDLEKCEPRERISYDDAVELFIGEMDAKYAEEQCTKGSIPKTSQTRERSVSQKPSATTAGITKGSKWHNVAKR